MRDKVAKVLGKIMNREKAAAFQQWYDIYQDSKEHAAQMDEVLKQAVLKMLNANLAKAFSRWHEAATVGPDKQFLPQHQTRFRPIRFLS